MSKCKKSNNGPTLGKTIGHGMASGFGIGAGLEASRAAIGGLFGSNNESNNKEVCKFEKDQLNICVNNKDSECKDLIELLNNCYKSQN